MKIPSPPQGIYYDIPSSVYHSWDAVSSTLIKKFASNPSTCRDPFIPSDDVNMGTGIHAFCLEGYKGLYRDCAIMPPECKGISKAAKEARLLFSAQNAGKTPLPPSCGSADKEIPTMDVLCRVNDSFMAHPKIGRVLSESHKEVSLVYYDTQNGTHVKARLDVWDSQSRVIWDIKKTRNISGLKWELDGGFMYRLQAAIYLNAAEACGLNPVAFGFMACEATEPFAVKAIYSDPDKTEAAQEDVNRLIGLYMQSVREDYWPNFAPPAGLSYWSDMSPDDLIEVW